MDAKSVLTLGSFMSVPENVKAASAGLHHALKMEYLSLPKEDGSAGLENVVIADRAMLDLQAVDMALINPETVIKDCEFLIGILKKNPDAIAKITAAFQADAPMEDMGVALDLVKGIGLTEDEAVKAGGGLIGLVVFLGATLIVTGVTYVVDYANGIKYKKAVARASGKDFEMQETK